MNDFNISIGPVTINVFSENDEYINNCKQYLSGFLSSTGKADIKLEVITQTISTHNVIIKDNKEVEFVNPEIFESDVDSCKIQSDCYDVKVSKIKKLGKANLSIVGNNDFLPLRNTLRTIFSWLLLFHSWTFFHGCALQKNNEGYLFLGKPSSGKSTIARKNKQNILSDECVAVKYHSSSDGESLFIMGTPFGGEFPAKDSKIYPLKKIFFLVPNEPLMLSKPTLIKTLSNVIENNFLFYTSDSRQNSHIARLIFKLSVKIYKLLPCLYLHSRVNDDIWEAIK